MLFLGLIGNLSHLGLDFKKKLKDNIIGWKLLTIKLKDVDNYRMGFFSLGLLMQIVILSNWSMSNKEMQTQIKRNTK